MTKPPLKRCAVYTRKSSEEGLEQDFNSLHAQREACEAYIRSQRGEGWQLVATSYDDGGISGGTMVRPGLQRLLADVEAGRIDIIVVYKVDRLTRSLADFARLVESFDRHHVSFVAVTQQFNTTSSMGRLTLNILLSFAQFEREVTGERIRDKISASKRKGLWMGGYVPLGYDADGRTLVVNPAEAETVMLIFQLYLELCTVRQLKTELDRRGIVSKARITPAGQRYGAKPYSRGALYALLANPVYIGEIRHKQETHPGLHEAIIDRTLWDDVQNRLADNRIDRRLRAGKVAPSPLMGRLIDEAGRVLTPSHAVKQGRRYRYYVSPQLNTGSADAATGWRLPAGEIEKIVAACAADLFEDEGAIADAVASYCIPAINLPSLFERGAAYAGTLRTPAQSAAALLTHVRRVELSFNGFDLICTLSMGDAGDLELRRFVPLRIKRRGIELRLVINGRRSSPDTDPALLKAIARAHAWMGEVLSGKIASAAAIAAREGIAETYVVKVMRLAFLAPEIVTAIIEGTHPTGLTADRLIQKRELPWLWVEQKALFGAD